MKEPINEIPIIGMWYKATDGRYKGFVGECVSFEPSDRIPVILQDLNYESKGFYIDEIERTIRQPTYKRDETKN